MPSRVSFRRSSRKTWPAWPARKPRCRASSPMTAHADAWTCCAPARSPRRIPRHAPPRLDPAGAGRRQVGRGRRARCCERFDFLPRWRIDDVMVSASPPRADRSARTWTSTTYSCCRRRANGAGRSMPANPPTGVPRRRRTQAAARVQPRPTTGCSEPGDMLYLPPGVPHHGVGEDACLTFSVGMRAPSSAELLGDFVDNLIADADESLRYHDPDLAPPTRPQRDRRRGHGPRGRGAEHAAHQRPGRARRLVRALHHHLSRRRRSDAPAGTQRSRIEIEWDLQQGAVLQRHPFSRMAWRRRRASARRALYFSGQEFACRRAMPQRIASGRCWMAPAMPACPRPAATCVFDLLAAGHYQLCSCDDGRRGMTRRPRSRSKPSTTPAGLAELRAVREAVFVQEQQVPLGSGMGRAGPAVPARDRPRCRDGQPIGTGRLTPEHKIGRMAVLRRLARPEASATRCCWR